MNNPDFDTTDEPIWFVLLVLVLLIPIASTTRRLGFH